MNMVAAYSEMPEHIPQGAIIGQRFRIDGVIAEGGMGVVYKGWHLVLEHPIAIKVMRAEYARHPQAVARFLNEARASAQLRGIHMTRVLDIGRIENGPPFMVLEYLDGQDLRSVLNGHGPLPVARAVRYIIQACEAVAEAHARGIVHRDLKPENLFSSQSSEGREILKVIDFGISKRLDSGARSFTIENQSLGSPQYMAPEQMSTPSQVDWRADVWSLGVVLFELLTKSVPFSGETFQVICVKVLRDEPESLKALRPDVPPAIENIIMRCLEKDPANRYSSVKELALALEPFAYAKHVANRQTTGEYTKARINPALSSVANPDGRDTDRTDLDQSIRANPRWPLALLALLIVCVVAVYRPEARSMSSALTRASDSFAVLVKQTYKRLRAAVPVTQDRNARRGR